MHPDVAAAVETAKVEAQALGFEHSLRVLSEASTDEEGLVALFVLAHQRSGHLDLPEGATNDGMMEIAHATWPPPYGTAVCQGVLYDPTFRRACELRRAIGVPRMRVHGSRLWRWDGREADDYGRLSGSHAA